MKNRQALILLFIANGISAFAQGISMLAIPWYFVIKSQGDTFNLIYAVVTGLTLFWSLYAGTIADRFNRKNIFLITNAFEGVILFIVAAYGFYYGEIPILLIGIIFGTTIFGYHIHYPTFYAFAQEVSEKDNYSRVNSIIEVVAQTTSVLAGGMAAILIEGIHINNDFISLHIEAWGLEKIFLMDGITYILALGIIAGIKYVPVSKLEVETGSLLKRLRSGFNYLNKHPDLFIFGFATYGIFVVMLVMLHAILPMYVANHLQKGGGILGIANIVISFGSILAGLIISKVFSKTSPIKSIFILMLITTGIMFVYGYTQSVLLFISLGFIFGFTNSGTRVLRLSYLFKHIPNNIIGRTNSIFSLSNVLLRFVFIMILANSFFKQGSNITYAWIMMGVFLILSLLLLFRMRKQKTNKKL